MLVARELPCLLRASCHACCARVAMLVARVLPCSLRVCCYACCARVAMLVAPYFCCNSFVIFSVRLCPFVVLSLFFGLFALCDIFCFVLPLLFCCLSCPCCSYCWRVLSLQPLFFCVCVCGQWPLFFFCLFGLLFPFCLSFGLVLGFWELRPWLIPRRDLGRLGLGGSMSAIISHL